MRPSAILVVPDGASEPLRADAPTAMEEAHTPVLDALAGESELIRVRTVPEGFAPGAEVGFARLLGVELLEAPARGRVEAAAADLRVPEGSGAWVLDVLPPEPLEIATAQRLDAAMAALGATLHHLGGHRYLLVGPDWWGDAPPGPHQTDRRLAELAAQGAFAGVAKAAKAALVGQDGSLRGWPWGRLGGPLDWRSSAARHQGITVVTTGGGAVEGVGRLAGARVVRAADGAAVDEVERLLSGEGATDGLIVVHDGRPDDAAHALDRNRKVEALTHFDAQVLGPVSRLAERHRVALVVCPSNGCDPDTGRHDGGPVPAVRRRATASAGASSAARCTERQVAHLATMPATALVVPATVQPTANAEPGVPAGAHGTEKHR